jgi:hypothetical protein
MGSKSGKTPVKKPPLAKAIPADQLGEPHAQLRDAAGKLLAGVVRKDGEWVFGLDGRIAGSTTSAAHVLALIKRAAELCRERGVEATLVFSAPLRAAAHAEAEAEGMAFEEFQRHLVTGLNADRPGD